MMHAQEQTGVPEVMTPEEAATFLRLSRSTIYQRPDIPRHRLPGSRQIRFLRSELLAWVKGEQPVPPDSEVSDIRAQTNVIEMLARPVSHRRSLYR